MTRSVCSVLAAALPSLWSLTLQGCCGDLAFAAFGASCPRLTSLNLEALSLPIKAMHGITTHLPTLTRFTLTSPKTCLDSLRLMAYVEACLRAFQPSTLLDSFDLSFDKAISLKCKPGSWSHLPPNLHNFDCDGRLLGILHATTLLNSLRILSTEQTPRFEQLIRILKLAPNLQNLYAWASPGCVMHCKRVDTMPGIAVLQERLLNGLWIRFPILHMVGSDTDVRTVLAALPVLRCFTARCVLQFIGDPQPDCLADVARVFPLLHELTLLTDSPMLDIPAVGTQMLEALAACTGLMKLWIRVQMNHTITDLVRLCLGMRALRVLHFVNSTGVSLPDLKSELATQGRSVIFHEISL